MTGDYPELDIKNAIGYSRQNDANYLNGLRAGSGKTEGQRFGFFGNLLAATCVAFLANVIPLLPAVADELIRPVFVSPLSAGFVTSAERSMVFDDCLEEQFVSFNNPNNWNDTHAFRLPDVHIYSGLTDDHVSGEPLFDSSAFSRRHYRAATELMLVVNEGWFARGGAFTGLKSDPSAFNDSRHYAIVGDLVFDEISAVLLLNITKSEDENIRPFSLNKSLFGGSGLSNCGSGGCGAGNGRNASGFGGAFGILNTFLHDSELVPKEPGLNGGNPSQNGSKNSSEADPYQRPPIGRRFLIALFCVFGTIFGGWRGGHYLYREKRIIASSWIVGGMVIGLLGIGLFIATGFPVTWGWIV